MAYTLDYQPEEGEEPESLYPPGSFPVPEECPECGAWGYDASDPHKTHCSHWREPDTEQPF